MNEFRAAWWCRNRHLQTVWGPLFRRKRLAFRRERFVLADGDFVDLDWLDTPAPAGAIGGVGPGHTSARESAIGGVGPGPASAPEGRSHASIGGSSRPEEVPLGDGVDAHGRVRVAAVVAGASDAPAGKGAPMLLVLHGLEGSSSSHYVVGLMDGARARGWRAVALNFRSCSGEMNRLPRFYHSGDTADLDAVVRLLIAREPGVRVGIVGASLGGNVLLKWLGELREDVPAAVAAAVGISVPFDLTPCARELDRGFGKHVYTRNFMRTMRQKVVDKARAHPAFVDVAAAQRARTFGAYDRAVTAPLFGFADERDYWRRASCRPFLPSITRPALVINAADDPFVPPDAIPSAAELSPPVELTLTRRGGHVGFLEGTWPWQLDSWAERRALDFLAPFLSAPAD